MKLFQDPAMVGELNTYINEMADPKFKAEQEEWIRQEETKGNVPEGRSVVHPKPAGLSFVTHYKNGTAREGQPFVVNLVRAEEIDRPEISPASDGSGAASVKVPAIAGPIRMEKGEGVGPLVGKGAEDAIWTVDVGVHTEAVARMMGTAATAKQWRKLLTEVALEQADRRAHQEASKISAIGAIPMRTGADMQLLALEKETKELKRGYVAGTSEPPSMLVPKAQASSASQGSQPAQQTQRAGAAAPASATNKAEKGSKQSEATKSAGSSMPSSPPVKLLKGPDGVYLRAPGYSIVERNPFQLGNHMQGTAPGQSAATAVSTRPREIKVDVALPGISRAAELDMDNDERELSVTTTTVFHDEALKPTPAPNSAGNALAALLGKAGSSPAPFRYHVKIKLPYPVSLDDRDTKAKWDRDTAVLSVTFTVQQPPAAPVEQVKSTGASSAPASSTADESELDDAKKVKASSSTSVARPIAPEKLPEAHSTWVKERVQATGAVPLSPLVPTPVSTPAPVEVQEDPSVRAGGEPPFRWRQMPGLVSVLFDVPAVEKDSVSLEWAGREGDVAQDLTISFKSKTSPIALAVAAGHAGAAALESQHTALEGLKGLLYVYSMQLRLAGRVKTGAPTRVDVSDSNVALILSKEKDTKWKELVRAPPEDVEAAASTAASPVKAAAAPAPAPVSAGSSSAAPLSYVVPPDTQRCKTCKGWGKDLLQADGRCAHCSRKIQAMAGSEKTDRVTAGPSAAAPAPAPARVPQHEEEEEEIFELGSNGTFDITKTKKKASIPTPVEQPTSASKSAGRAPKAAGLLDLD